MAVRRALAAALVAAAALPAPRAAGGVFAPGAECGASGAEVRVGPPRNFSHIQARVSFGPWGRGAFSRASHLSDGAVALEFADGAGDGLSTTRSPARSQAARTELTLGCSGNNALKYRATRVLVQRTAYYIGGLAAEAELRVEFNRSSDGEHCCSFYCHGLPTESTGAVLVLMVSQAAAASLSQSDKSLSERLGAFLEGATNLDLDGVNGADFDPVRAMTDANAAASDRQGSSAVYFSTDPLAHESSCVNVVHIVGRLPLASSDIPHQFREQLRLPGSDLELPEFEEIFLAPRPFPDVGPFSLEALALRRKWFFTYVALLNLGLLAAFFLLEWRKRDFVCATSRLSDGPRLSSGYSRLGESAPVDQEPQRPMAWPSLQRVLRPGVIECAEDGAFDPQVFSIQRAEETNQSAVREYLNLLDVGNRRTWSTWCHRLVCLLIFVPYVLVCYDVTVTKGDEATCYEGIPWENVKPMLHLYIGFKVVELALLATSKGARGTIRFYLLPVRLLAGFISFFNAFTDLVGITVAEACWREGWAVGMFTICILGIVLLRWTVLPLLSVLLDRSNKCLYRILHMNVLAESIKIHPEDCRAPLLWTVIWLSEFLVQDLLMTGVQLWFLLKVERYSSMAMPIIVSVGSMLISCCCGGRDSAVIFGPEDLEPLRAIVDLQDYMAQRTEDYEAACMESLIRNARAIALLTKSETLKRAERFKVEQEVQIEEGSKVRANYKGRAVTARVKMINSHAHTVKLEFEGSSGEEGMPRGFVDDVDRPDVVEDLDLTNVMADLGFIPPSRKKEDLDILDWATDLPPLECQVMKSLRRCQRSALTIVRRSATEQHNAAWGRLRERCDKLQISEAGIQELLDWILWDAPIIVHIDLDTVGRYLKNDKYYKNQFETGTTKGVDILPIREGWEDQLFTESYREADPHERPKYGVLNLTNDPSGECGAKDDYGKSYIVLKQVRLRCTVTPEDSCQSKAREHVGTLDKCAHVLCELSDPELLELHRVATALEDSPERIGKSSKRDTYQYKEVQIHGELDLKKHVRRLVVDPMHLFNGLFPHKDGEKMEHLEIERLCQEHGWEISYIGDPDSHNAKLFKTQMPWERNVRLKQQRRRARRYLARSETSRSEVATSPGTALCSPLMWPML